MVDPILASVWPTLSIRFSKPQDPGKELAAFSRRCSGVTTPSPQTTRYLFMLGRLNGSASVAEHGDYVKIT